MRRTRGRLGGAARAQTEEERKVCKLRFFPTVPTLLTHVFLAHQSLEAKFLGWEELRHPNILPFYGAYVPKPSPRRFSRPCRSG